MDRHLTRRELDNTRNFIKLDIGKKIIPVKIMSTSDSRDGGYSLIFWEKDSLDCRFNHLDSIGIFYPEIYPVEDIGPRLRLKKQMQSVFCPSGNSVPASRNNSLVRGKNNVYRISPAGCGIMVPVYSSDDYIYNILSQRLMQEELTL